MLSTSNAGICTSRELSTWHTLLRICALMWCIVLQEFHTKYLAATAAVVLIIGPFFAGHLRPVRPYTYFPADVSYWVGSSVGWIAR